eukprot:14215664-Alexandrium_andersonii.AAC.1
MRPNWVTAKSRERSNSCRATSQPTGHQRSKCSLPNSPTPHRGQGSDDLPPARESKWQRPIARRAGCQLGGPTPASSMPRAVATQLAPSWWTDSIGRQSLHQAMPELPANGVVNATDTLVEWQQQQVR